MMQFYIRKYFWRWFGLLITTRRRLIDFRREIIDQERACTKHTINSLLAENTRKRLEIGALKEAIRKGSRN